MNIIFFFITVHQIASKSYFSNHTECKCKQCNKFHSELRQKSTFMVFIPLWTTDQHAANVLHCWTAYRDCFFLAIPAVERQPGNRHYQIAMCGASVIDVQFPCETLPPKTTVVMKSGPYDTTTRRGGKIRIGVGGIG